MSKSNRRSFIKKGIGAAMLPVLFPELSNISEYSTWKEIRDQFPLKRTRTYLNNGTFGPSPYSVLKTINESFTKTNTSGEYGNTKEARSVLANFVGVRKEEISLTHNTTEGINVICWGLDLKKGDEVIITLHEHVGNALPWLNRARLDGLILKPFEPAGNASENISRIKNLITAKTKVIAIPHITCTTGLVFPIKEIAKIARKKGIFTAIDGAHGPGTLDLDLKDLGCDSYATSCHKWMLGPNGTGFLYIKEDNLDKLQAKFVGAYSDTGWDLFATPPQIKGYNPTAHRFDYGSQSKPLYDGAAAAANFHMDIGKQKIEKRVRELNQYLFEGLSNMNGELDILSPHEKKSRVCMVTFKPKNYEYKNFAQKISKAGFRIRQLPESNLDAIRISTHIYNSKEEIDKLVQVIERLL